MGPGANTDLLSDTLLSIGLSVFASERAKVWLRKKTLNLCASGSEEDEHGVGPGVNTDLLSDIRERGS